MTRGLFKAGPRPKFETLGSGPFYIRSRYWGSWHCKGTDGGASGYTNDILKAGVFGIEKAREYHETSADGRDEAIPAVEVLAMLEASVEERRAELAQAESVIASVKSAVAG